MTNVHDCVGMSYETHTSGSVNNTATWNLVSSATTLPYKPSVAAPCSVGALMPPGCKVLSMKEPDPEKVIQMLRELSRELKPRQRRKVERIIKRLENE